jgi:nitrilase
MTTKKKRDDNINRIFDSIRSANETNNIDLVVLPELSTIEYSTEAFRNVKELAEPIDGETFYKASKLSKEINAYMAYGFPRIEMGNYFISHVVINPNGRYVTHYDKIHIAQFGASEEKPFFERGNKLGIFEVGDVKIGIIICYDFRFTEYVNWNNNLL